LVKILAEKKYRREKDDVFYLFCNEIQLHEPVLMLSLTNSL